MLRKCVKYPLSSIIDGTISVDGHDCSVIHTDSSLAFRLDIDIRDNQIQSYIRDALSPSNVQYLDTETLKKDNVFDMLNPLTSRFVTDNAIRNNIVSSLIEEAKTQREKIQADKEKADLKKKYDEFIASLS